MRDNDEKLFSGFIASFESIFAQTEHMGSGTYSLLGAIVKPSSKNLLSYYLMKSPFCLFLRNPYQHCMIVSSHVVNLK